MRKFLLCAVTAFLLVGCPNRNTVSDTRGPIYGSCLGGDATACFEYGRTQPADSKDRISRNSIVAFQYACFQGDQPSCSEIGRIYGVTELAVDRDRKNAALNSSCDSGELESCLAIADSLPRFRAKPLYERACGGDVAPACTRLASILRQTWKMESNLVRALDLEKKACKLGDPMGCYSAGQAYLFGSGVDKDPETAQTLFDQSCNEKTGVGCRALGKIYRDGLGVRADINAANRFYDLSERHKVVDRKQTRRSAYLLYVDACNYGDVLGCFNAGWFNAEGVEVQRNISTSRGFFERACNEGLDAACAKWKDVQPKTRKIVTRERKKLNQYDVDADGNRTERKP